MEHTGIKVSIIITTYNQEKYIEKAIQSVLTQKVDFPIEILIGDDRSSDNTVDTVLRYAKQFPEQIVPVCNKVNLGASQNFYQLLQKARGQYIAILEGDDFWIDPYKLSKQVKYLDNNPNASGCVHNTQLVDEFGIPLQTQRLAWIRPCVQYKLKDFDGEHLPGHISSLVFRNFMLDAVCNFWILTAHQQISDRCIFLVLLALGTIEHIPQCMSSYRILRNTGDGNLTKELYLSEQKIFYDDMRLLTAMEKWLLQECDVSKRFTRAKSRVFAAFLFGRNSKKSRSLAAAETLLREGEYPLKLLIYLPISIWERMILHFTKVQR